MSSSKAISQARIGHEVPSAVAVNNSLIIANRRARSAILAGSSSRRIVLVQNVLLFFVLFALDARQLRSDLCGSEHSSHF